MLPIKLLPKQWEVFNPDDGVDYDIKLYQGGVGSGKTFLGAVTGCRTMSENHGSTWIVVADTYARLKITTCETYESLLDAAKIKYKFNRTDKIIKIPGWGDSRVIFKGVDDPMALRSVNAIGAHIEEASLITETAYTEVLGRLRQAQAGTPIRVILTTNPQASKGWLYAHFVEQAGISVQSVRDKEIRVNRRRVIARTLDNPYVSDAFIAALKTSYDEELWKIMVLGQDGDYTRGLVSHNFSDLNIQPVDYNRESEVYLTCDFNVDPMSWAAAHRQDREYRFFDEIVIENTNINECVDVFVQRYPDAASVVITGDASGNNRDVRTEQVGGTSFTQMINRFNYHKYPGRVRLDVREKNPPILDRVAAWNGAVCDTNGVRKVFMDPRCKWLINNCQNLRYKEGTSEIYEPTQVEIRNDPKKKFIKHIFDAASYLVEKYDPIIRKSVDNRSAVIVPKAIKNRFRNR
jgi:phage terminase large subunit